MMKEFNVSYQFALYLERVDLNLKTLSLVQATETKRAFFGAWGQLLMLMRDEAGLPESDIIEAEENMVNQVAAFWEKQVSERQPGEVLIVDDQTAEYIETQPEEILHAGEKIELKIFLTRGEGREWHTTTSFPNDSNAVMIKNALEALTSVLQGKMADKVEKIVFRNTDDIITYLESLTMKDL